MKYTKKNGILLEEEMREIDECDVDEFDTL